MLDFFAAGMAPFTVALLVMLGIGAIELVALLMGFSPSAAIDASLPDFDPPEVDVDGPDGAIELGPLSATLNWLSVGKVPFLVLLVIFLTSFGLGGYLVQAITTQLLGSMMPAWLAALPALTVAAYACRHLGAWFGRVFPQVETDATSQKDLVGGFATIIRGEARQGAPAEAKTKDGRGRTHYILVEPEEAGQALTAGRRVFLIRQQGNIYRAVTRVERN